MRPRASTSPIGPGWGPFASIPPGGFDDYPLELVATDSTLQVYCRVENGFVTESGGVASQVNDRTTYTRHATQASALLRPDLDTTSWSQWAVAFNGGTVLGHVVGLANAMPSNNWTKWAVYHADSTAGNQGIWCISASAGGYSLTIEGGKRTIRHQPSGVTQDGNADTNRHSVIITRSSGTDHMIVDGVEVSLGATPTAPAAPSAASHFGALLADLTFPFLGWGFEWGAMSRVLTGGAPGVGSPATGECARLVSYFNARYT